MSKSSSEFLGHPKGLYVLFMTEMWERFSFYGMRALLVYYMIKHLMYEQSTASHIFGLYAGFAYFTPLFGGMLADRVLGQRKTVVLGGILMAIGHFLMAFESLFFLALVFIILGNGAFKPNISTQVGDLYPAKDPRRDRAFSIFYVGINLGAFLAPLICGTLGETYGWHYGFGAAGVGMLLGLAIYILGQKHLAPDPMATNRRQKTEKQPLTVDEKNRLWGLAALCFFNIFFWAVYEQQANTLALWADGQTNRHIFGGGWEMPASWFQSVNPAFIFALTPLLNMLWGAQARRQGEPTSATKMALGCLFLGMSFLVMIPAAQIQVAQGLVSAWWLIACLFFATLGELYLSPVGLSLVTKVAPQRLLSTLMGTWMLSWFAGEYLAGFFGMYWEKMSKEQFFMFMATVAIGSGVGILLALKPIQRALGMTDQKVITT